MRTDDRWRDAVRTKIDAIEHELRRTGAWQVEPPSDAQLAFTAPFGADRLAFRQWLQFVLIPRVHDALDGRSAFPGASAVAAYAVRELDGERDADRLLHALAEFDALFGPEPIAAANPPEVRAVHDFLAALRDGDAVRARTFLVRRMRNDPTFEPSAPVQIESFTTAPAERHPDCCVVRTRIQGVEASGATAEQSMPFVLVDEDGAWRIDLERSAGMQITGDPHAGTAAIEAAMTSALDAMTTGLADVMSGIGDAIGDAFQTAANDDRAQSERWFRDEGEPVAEAALRERLGHDVDLVVELDEFALGDRTARRLQRFVVDELDHAFALLSGAAHRWSVDDLRRVGIRATKDAADRGLRRIDDALVVAVDPALDDDWLRAPTLACVMTLEATPDLAERIRYGFERAGRWADTWRDTHGVQATFDVAWRQFVREDDERTAWALHLAVEQGIEPLGAAILDVLATTETIVERFREERLQVVLEFVDDPEWRAIQFEERSLVVRIHVAEGFGDGMDAAQFAAEITKAVTGAN